MEDPDADEDTPADPAILKETIIKWRRKKPNRKPAQSLLQLGLERAQEATAVMVDITPMCDYTVVETVPLCVNIPTAVMVKTIPLCANLPTAMMVDAIPLEQSSKRMTLAQFYKTRQNVPDERYQELATRLQELLADKGKQVGFAIVAPCTPKAGTGCRLCCGPIQICMCQKTRPDEKHIDYYYLLLSVDDDTSGSFYRSVPTLLEGLLGLPFDITAVMGNTSAMTVYTTPLCAYTIVERDNTPATVVEAIPLCDDAIAMMVDTPPCDYAVMVDTTEIYQ